MSRFDGKRRVWKVAACLVASAALAITSTAQKLSCADSTLDLTEKILDFKYELDGIVGYQSASQLLSENNRACTTRGGHELWVGTSHAMLLANNLMIARLRLMQTWTQVSVEHPVSPDVDETWARTESEPGVRALFKRQTSCLQAIVTAIQAGHLSAPLQECKVPNVITSQHAAH